MQTCIWPSLCHCHSLSLASVKSRLVSPFWYHLTELVLDRGSLNRCVCVAMIRAVLNICFVFALAPNSGPNNVFVFGRIVHPD